MTGDAAIALLKAGAETDKKDVDGRLALELAPGMDVRASLSPSYLFRLLILTVETGPEIHPAEGRGGRDRVVAGAS